MDKKVSQSEWKTGWQQGERGDYYRGFHIIDSIAIHIIFS